MKTTSLVLLAMLFFASAHAATITQHAIQITVDASGGAQVTERFVFFFNSERERIDFRRQAQRLGADLESWRLLDSNITHYIGSIKPGTGRIGYEEIEGDRLVKLEYQTSDPIFTAVETPRQIEYSINFRAFESFRQGSVFVIPSNTKISFFLPKQARIQSESLKPELEADALQQAITEKKIFWSGHLSISGNLGLRYVLEKQIAPAVSVSQILQQMMNTGEASLLAAVALVLLGMGYFKRKSIQQKIEKYLEEHSEITPQKENEEMDIEE